ncbi:MAG: TolB-like 6-bladed beta-propeller domain-containing protein [Duncaniella sp.]|nr:TolB-like 6-bladed beta-propeller domain-containing protein [Duncaniella sp.]
MSKKTSVILSGCIAAAMYSCNVHDKTSQPIDIHALVTEFTTGETLIGKHSTILTSDSSIFILDHQSVAETIHMFDAITGKHLKSFGKFGQGPTELTRPGQIAYSPERREIYVFDYGQNHIMAFNVDSAVTISDYTPREKLKFDTGQTFPDRYIHVNDTLGYARSIKAAKQRGFTQSLCRYNLSDGQLEEFGNSEAKHYANRSLFAVSPQKRLVAEACSTQDLLIVYDFDGNIVARYEGSEYTDDINRSTTYFTDVEFVDDFILCAYSGDTTGKNYYGSLIKVFDSSGIPVKTFDSGRKIMDFSYNPADRSLLLTFDDEMQFGKLPLTGLLD